LISIHAIGETGNEEQFHDVAYIRLFLPLKYLCEKEKFKLTTGKTFAGFENKDIYFIQRSWSKNINTNSVKAFLKIIRSGKKKLIYEIDDNLLDNPDISSEKKMVIRCLAGNADVVIVSTLALKKRLEFLNKNITVIPNFMDLNVINMKRDKQNKNNKIIIGYMGTSTHQKDFKMIKLPLMKIINKYKSKISFELIGAIENESEIRSLANTKIHNRGAINDYFSFWRWMNDNCFWDIGIAPLKNDEFTKCKSDIKYLDYSALGMAGVYSKHPSYEYNIKHKETGLLADNTCEAWQSALEELICNENLRNSIKLKARNDLMQNRILQNNTDLWLKVIK